ncbi:MAG: ferrous iron transport protein B [Candidatus Syntrophonatronum acetioxidans]|uniref:Ferrous iron transport protein B n=1 Tax=Candidatus Syntrophonatronum acetioxidans TaxID=1795816 RepID=A0A424YAS8_9FIRM|nr:MAG: ferrous iron transport protein B [Candidatus Syntrophonatronum acetioxidans]
MGRGARVVLVGRPNVGKSVLFNQLTNSLGMVSNYPGTTVEVRTGESSNGSYQVLDTPGIFSMLPISAEEEVTLSILLERDYCLVVQVVEAKNLEKSLPFTIQLLEAGLPLILVVNMLDEGEKLGIRLNLEELERQLKVPVAGTVATGGKGLKKLKQVIEQELRKRGAGKDYLSPLVDYSPSVERSLKKIVFNMEGIYRFSKRSLGLMFLQGESRAEDLLKEGEGNNYRLLKEIREIECRDFSLLINSWRLHKVREMLKDVARVQEKESPWRHTLLNRITIHPLGGLPLLFLVLYVGLYKFVGVFGAGTLVDYLDGYIFQEWVIPHMKAVVEFLPLPGLSYLLVSPYGIFTLGLRYGLAIVLPVVSIFFLFLSLVEDSGYLPRLAMLLDRLFKMFGLNGRGVIPLVLGLGCGTMAVLSTRTLEGKREKFIAVFLLALGIPCSAQLGIILAMLAMNPAALVIWGISLLTVLGTTGYLMDKILPGEAAKFYMEIPPLRIPQPVSVIKKTLARIQWYMKEVIPLFIVVSLVMLVSSLTGLLGLLTEMVAPFLQAMGLPRHLTSVFMIGFFRRDYGAAGLYTLLQEGQLTVNQLLVGSLTLSLFLPCIAQFVMIIKEQGYAKGLVILILVILLAFLAGYLLNLLITGLPWSTGI